MIPVILKGDTSAKISLNVADGWDFSAVVLEVGFCGVVKTIVEPVAGSVIDVAFTAEQSASFPLGTHMVTMTLRNDEGGRCTLPWGKIKVTDAPGEVYDAAISVDPGTIAVDDATAADSLGDVKAKLNKVLDYLRGVTVGLLVAFALPCFGAGVQTATLNDIPGNAQVVTNVTLEGLASADDALLAIYYPEGNVTNVSQITTEGLVYSYDDTAMTATLTNGLSATGDVVIPWRVAKDGAFYTVTAIGDHAFYDAVNWIGSNITSIISPTSMMSIGHHAFASCTALTSVSLPSVTSVGSGAFIGCESLKSVSLPSVIGIESDAFFWCRSLKSVSLPSVISIEANAFNECHTLKSVSLPSVTSIGPYAFDYCHALKSVDFGATPRDTVPTLGQDAFYPIPGLCRFIIPLGMYDEWISAPGWSNLYAEGYKFIGYANAADIPKSAADIGAASTNALAAVESKIITAPAATNIARAVQNTVYDNALGVGWTAYMHDGSLYYIATTNAPAQEVK